MFRKLLRLEREGFALYVKAILVCFLIWQGIVCAVMVVLRPEESILISGALFPWLSALVLLYLLSSDIFGTFQSGLCMGCTRRRMLGMTLGLGAVQTLLMGALCGALILLERTVCIQLWAFLAGRPGAAILREAPGGGKLWEPIFDTGVLRIEEFSLSPWLIPLLILGGALTGLIVGTFGQRFGPRNAVVLPFVAMWAVFLIPSWLPEPYAAALSPLQIPLFLLILAAGTAWSLWSLLHAAISK